MADETALFFNFINDKTLRKMTSKLGCTIQNKILDVVDNCAAHPMSHLYYNLWTKY